MFKKLSAFFSTILNILGKFIKTSRLVYPTRQAYLWHVYKIDTFLITTFYYSLLKTEPIFYYTQYKKHMNNSFKNICENLIISDDMFSRSGDYICFNI